MMARAVACLSFVLGMTVASIAHAQSPAGCEEIAAAFTKLGTVPALREKIDMAGTILEAVIIGDDMHMHMDGQWTKMPLPPGGRQKLFENMFNVISVRDCRRTGQEDLAGRTMVVYAYVLNPIEGLSKEPVEQQVWVGADDGLPYRAKSKDGVVEISYDNVVAPQ